MGTGANQIATKKDLYTAFGAFASASTSRECPTYAEIIAEGLIVSTTLDSKRLVKYSLISKPATASAISISRSTWQAPNSASSITVTVTLTNATGFTVSDNATWISTSKTGNGVVVAINSANTSTSARTGYVTFMVSESQAGDGISRHATLVVTQAAAAAEPIIRMYITNFESDIVRGVELDEPWTVGGVNGDIYDAYGLNYDLYCFDGSVGNSIWGTYAQWSRFIDGEYGYDNVYIFDPYGDHASDYLGESDLDNIWELISDARTDGVESVNYEWPAPSKISVSPTTLSFGSTASSKTATVTCESTSFTVSESLSWLSYTKSGKQLTITVTANNSTSPRSGTITLSYGGDNAYINVTQSAGSSYQVPITYSTKGWMNGNDKDLDLYLTVQFYNGSSLSTICSNKSVVDGYPNNGNGDATHALGTGVTIGALNTCYLSVYGILNSVTAGNVWIRRKRSGTYGSALTSVLSIADEWSGSSSNPVFKYYLTDHQDGDSYDIIFEADDSGGSGSGSTSKQVWTENRVGGWVVTTSTPSSGHSMYQSNNSYHVNSGFDIMRIYLTGYGGETFRIYIRSSAETTWDYTVAGKLDTALPTTNTNSSTSYPKGSGKTMPTNFMAWTHNNQQTGTALSNYTAVDYTIPTDSQHFIDVAFVKDGSGNQNSDRGYVLIPNTYLA